MQVYSELSKFEIEEILYNATKRLSGSIERQNSKEISYSGQGNFLDYIKHPGLSRYTCWQVLVTITDLDNGRKVELIAVGESPFSYLLNNFLSIITFDTLFQGHRNLNFGISKEKAKH
ncbi:hypothetical protein HK259_06710, partial [Streptococcus agalactiae]|nr:hypothetical protein [Streptococcus agalactiae]